MHGKKTGITVSSRGCGAQRNSIVRYRIQLGVTLLVLGVVLYGARAEDEVKKGAQAVVSPSLTLFMQVAGVTNVPAVPRIQLSPVPNGLKTELAALARGTDKQAVLPGMATVFLRYAVADAEAGGPSALVTRDQQVVDFLMVALTPEIDGDEIVASALANWLCENKEKVGDSEAFVKATEQYLQARRKREMRYRRMAEPTVGGDRAEVQ